MDRNDRKTNRDFNNIQLFGCTLICAFLLILAGQKTGLISVISQEMITLTLEWSGYSVEKSDGGFQVGKIWVPWSPGCSGYNGLIFCIILTLWLGRKQQFSKRIILRLLSCIPAALAANMLRISCILVYRFIAYPEDETPELHFLIGFLTLLPCIYLLNYRTIHSVSRFQRMEILYLAAIFSILIPVTWEPGGWGIALAGFSLLGLHHRLQNQSNMRWLLAGWFLSGLLIGYAQMESLWLPWMLICPFFLNVKNIIKKPTSSILWLSTFSVIAMLSFWPYILLAALIIEWLRFKHTSENEITYSHIKATFVFACIIGLSFPFFLPLLSLKPVSIEPPPENGIIKKIGTYKSIIRFIGQQNNLTIYWFNSPNQGRHHAAAICMQFSGSNFEQISKNIISTDSQWITERFVVQGKCLEDYQSYLWHTWLPWVQCGAHVIITGDKKAFSQIGFETAVDEAVNRWLE